ncbi:hypothetical protein BPLS_P3715 [Bathymodiolus platifrons methanotrophic gill symbiont]|nr:hypothetical protein BPLS_P3715 [Bathymodiolus platifrons methanotrophic gill symbiont]
MLRSQHRVYDGSGEVARTQDVWGAEGISGRVKFLPLAWAGMPKTSFRKNSDSPLASPNSYRSTPPEYSRTNNTVSLSNKGTISTAPLLPLPRRNGDLICSENSDYLKVV